MLYFNLILTLVCFWIVLRINSLFIQPAIWNRHRFNLFALRDNLAVLAMRGIISEKSEEYVTLMAMLNKAVHETNKFKTINFLRFLIAVKKNEKLQEKISNIFEKINHEDVEYQAILHKYFATVHEIFKLQTKSFYIFVPHLIVILGFLKILDNLVSALQNKVELVDSLGNEILKMKEKSLPARA